MHLTKSMSCEILNSKKILKSQITVVISYKERTRVQKFLIMQKMDKHKLHSPE